MDSEINKMCQQKITTVMLGCCVPLMTHHNLLCIHSVSLGQSGFLAPALPSWPGLFLAAAHGCYGERRPFQDMLLLVIELARDR